MPSIVRLLSGRQHCINRLTQGACMGRCGSDTLHVRGWGTVGIRSGVQLGIKKLHVVAWNYCQPQAAKCLEVEPDPDLTIEYLGHQLASSLEATSFLDLACHPALPCMQVERTGRGVLYIPHSIISTHLHRRTAFCCRN